jgi:Transposase, Mutator family
VTDVVADEITEWRGRPLDAFYAILYIDALVVKVRDSGAVENKAAYLVTGVDADGFKHVLGIWLGTAEGSRFWAGVLAKLRNRGIKDVLFVCCDGLNGLPEATWPKAKVQACVIHYPDTAVMPIPGGLVLAGGGGRACGIGIITTSHKYSPRASLYARAAAITLATASGEVARMV